MLFGVDYFTIGTKKNTSGIPTFAAAFSFFAFFSCSFFGGFTEIAAAFLLSAVLFFVLLQKRSPLKI